MSDCFMTIKPTKAGPWRIMHLIHFHAVAFRLGVSEAHLRRMVRRLDFPPPEDFEGAPVYPLKRAERAIAAVEKQRRADQGLRARRPAAPFPHRRAPKGRQRHLPSPKHGPAP